MNEYKILFTGTMGAGKTTAIACISDTKPIVTDVVNTDKASAKERTTVALDFGEINLDTGDRIRLYGTPGQARFDFMWKILVKNAIGLIILVDNSREDPISDLDVYLNGFNDDLDSLPCAIGLGRTDSHANPGIDDYIQYLAQKNRIIPILEVDVRKRDDVLLLVDALLAQIEAQQIGVNE